MPERTPTPEGCFLQKGVCSGAIERGENDTRGGGHCKVRLLLVQALLKQMESRLLSLLGRSEMTSITSCHQLPCCVAVGCSPAAGSAPEVAAFQGWAVDL